MRVANLVFLLVYVIHVQGGYKLDRPHHYQHQHRPQRLHAEDNDVRIRHDHRSHHRRPSEKTFKHLDKVDQRLDSFKFRSHVALDKSSKDQRGPPAVTDDGWMTEYDEYEDEEEDPWNDDLSAAWKSEELHDKSKHKVVDDKNSFDEDQMEENDDDEEMEEDYDEEFVEERKWPQDHAIIQNEEEVISDVTKYKWNNFGTRAKVEESRWRLSSSSSDGSGGASGNRDLAAKYRNGGGGDLPLEQVESAMHHMLRIKNQIKCGVPKARVVDVQGEHPNPGTRYTPHCTILHRCAEDTGCCTTPDTKCQPKKQTLIYLYFYSTTLTRSSHKLEKLSFYNHTECGCTKIDSVPELEATPQRLVRSGATQAHATTFNRIRPTKKPCTCPSEFVPRQRHDSKCACDCPPASQGINSNEDVLSGCLNMKRGKEHFSLTDRRCINEEKCTAPTCEFGPYIKSLGRCPRNQESQSSNWIHTPFPKDTTWGTN